MTILLAVAQFLGGAILVIAATESLVKGLVGVSRALQIAPFVASALLSGLEAENIAVGLAADHTGLAEVALGTVYGRAIFMLTVALGAVPRFSGVARVCPKGRAWRALEVRSHRVATVARAAPLLS